MSPLRALLPFLLVAAPTAAAPAAASAQTVRLADLELLRLRRSVEAPSQSLNSAVTVGYGLGLLRPSSTPYAMVQLGWVNVGARVGVWLIPRGFRRAGPVARWELRGQWLYSSEGALTVSLALAVGWRDAGGRSGLFSVDAGPVWAEGVRWYVGWSVVLALDVAPRALARARWLR